MTQYVHLLHVNGEIGDVDDELILGPFPNGVQLTYCWLRENENGENIAAIRDGQWYTVDRWGYPIGGLPSHGERGPFSDVVFTDELPETLVERSTA